MAKSAIKLKTAEMMGWLVNDEKKVPRATNAEIKSIRPKELAIRYPKSMSAQIFIVDNIRKI
jgi:hypothetical protein